MRSSSREMPTRPMRISGFFNLKTSRHHAGSSKGYALIRKIVGALRSQVKEVPGAAQVEEQPVAGAVVLPPHSTPLSNLPRSTSKRLLDKAQQQGSKSPPSNKRAKVDFGGRVHVHYVLVHPQGFLQTLFVCRWNLLEGWDEGVTRDDHRGGGYLLEIPIERCSGSTLRKLRYYAVMFKTV
ncbi:hypothetical protein BD311DRAFT_800069 [Dichomitus squalens]|uniref:Uncharacterized protein n=1 Tax=Dichomitus squalens TaxID=114155 RepID=A0A4Q9M8B4_9APHY|nr:hypothetical protein BD311DRAFT_800069 [Dichomitus squalens]